MVRNPMSSRLFESAKEYAKKAYELDRQKRYREAEVYYLKAAEILQKLINFTENVSLKNLYYQRAMEYIYRVRELRGDVQISSSSSSATHMHRGSSSVSEEDKEKSELEKAIESIIIAEKPNIGWDDIANLEEAKRALREAVILPMKRKDLFTGARKAWRGILLFGPPGTGKTLLAKAVANEADATFFSVSAANLISKWLGESEKLVDTLYKVAREKAPSIIFFDEVDALLGARGQSGEHDSVRRVKNQLLQAIQGLSGDGDVITIGATNTPWDIDVAMRRRFERRIYIPLPTEESRKVIFQIHTRGIELDPDVDFDLLAKYTVGYSGADISLVCREALMRPIRELDASGLLEDPNSKPRNPNMNDFLMAIKKIKPSVSPDEITRYEEWNQQFGG